MTTWMITSFKLFLVIRLHWGLSWFNVLHNWDDTQVSLFNEAQMEDNLFLFLFFKQSPTGLTCILFSTSPCLPPFPPSSLWQQIKQKPPGFRLNCEATVFLSHLKVVFFLLWSRLSFLLARSPGQRQFGEVSWCSTFTWGLSIRSFLLKFLSIHSRLSDCPLRETKAPTWPSFRRNAWVEALLQMWCCACLSVPFLFFDCSFFYPSIFCFNSSPLRYLIHPHAFFSPRLDSFELSCARHSQQRLVSPTKLAWSFSMDKLLSIKVQWCGCCHPSIYLRMIKNTQKESQLLPQLWARIISFQRKWCFNKLLIRTSGW